VNLFNGLTIDEVASRHLELFNRLHFRDEPSARPNECYANCNAKAERDGGKVIVGWRRDRAIQDGPDLIASLAHHAVWENPDGEMFDITPSIAKPNGVETIIKPNFVDFMPDPSATFDDPRRSRPAVHVPLVPDGSGDLKKACERMDRSNLLLHEGDMEKAQYENGKAAELVKGVIKRADEQRLLISK
jgi:hypothetical protein